MTESRLDRLARSDTYWRGYRDGLEGRHHEALEGAQERFLPPSGIRLSPTPVRPAERRTAPRNPKETP